METTTNDRKTGRSPKRKSRVIYLSLERALADKVLADADRSERSISAQVSFILRHHYEGKRA